MYCLNMLAIALELAREKPRGIENDVSKDHGDLTVKSVIEPQSGQQPLYFAAVISLVTLPLPSRN